MDFSYSEIKNFTAKSLKTVSWAVTCRIQVKLFKEIEDYVQKKANSSDQFSQLIKRVEKKDSTIKKYSYELKEISKLRKIIVHGSKFAIPTDYSINMIKKIRYLLYNPPKVYPLFSNDVMTRSVDTYIITTLKIMKETDYSQIPYSK